MTRKPAGWPEQNLPNLHHRGPDEQSHVVLGCTQLGHTRLSIIDLAGGSQPMTDVDRRATLVYNGEIYNYAELRAELAERGHRFATHSDTEVILAAYLAWGVEGFARLRGMYALALHDLRDGSTVLARDPFGIKPLFVTKTGAGFFFASEQAALLDLIGVVPDLDLTSVLETLVHRHPFAEHTLYRGVERLAPGIALTIAPRAEGARTTRFADLTSEVENHRQNGAAKAATADAEERVIDSVRHHAIADVPVGCFLSGGLDSSIVARCLVNQGGGPLNAYSVGFAAAKTEQSELEHARAVAQAIGANLTEIEVSAADFVALAPKLSGTLNGPFPDPADIAMLRLSMEAATAVKVVLTGEGSDEAFAGYPKYAADRFAGPLRLPMSLADRTLRRRGRLGIAASALAERQPARRWLRWFQNDEVPAGLADALTGGGADPNRAVNWVEERISFYPGQWSNMQRMQLLDLESWLPNNLLHRGDYTTMQASLEQRVPLLDFVLTPWAVALPDRLKVKGMRGKRILREAFESQLPAQVVKRPKSGFRLPLGEWLREDDRLRQMLQDQLRSPNAGIRDWLPAAEVDALLAPSALATGGGAKLAWTVMCLELWLQSTRRTPSLGARSRGPLPEDRAAGLSRVG